MRLYLLLFSIYLFIYLFIISPPPTPHPLPSPFYTPPSDNESAHPLWKLLRKSILSLLQLWIIPSSFGMFINKTKTVWYKERLFQTPLALSFFNNSSLPTPLPVLRLVSQVMMAFLEITHGNYRLSTINTTRKKWLMPNKTYQCGTDRFRHHLATQSKGAKPLFNISCLIITYFLLLSLSLFNCRPLVPDILFFIITNNSHRLHSLTLLGEISQRLNLNDSLGFARSQFSTSCVVVIIGLFYFFK